MKKHLSFSLRKFRFGSICTLLIAILFIFSDISANSQIYRKRSDRRSGRRGGKVEFKKNIVWLEGLGSNQAVGVKYERIFMFGSHVSMRFDLGVTPFVLDERYNFYVGRSITPITGLGFYYHFNPGPLRIGVGCSALHDIFFEGIPEVTSDTTGAFGDKTYRARVMPYILAEITLKDRWTIRAGYSPIIDPANDAQTQTYVTHWAMIGVGYKFGR